MGVYRCSHLLERGGSGIQPAHLACVCSNFEPCGNGDFHGTSVSKQDWIWLAGRAVRPPDFVAQLLGQSDLCSKMRMTLERTRFHIDDLDSTPDVHHQNVRDMTDPAFIQGRFQLEGLCSDGLSADRGVQEPEIPKFQQTLVDEMPSAP